MTLASWRRAQIPQYPNVDDAALWAGYLFHEKEMNRYLDVSPNRRDLTIKSELFSERCLLGTAIANYIVNGSAAAYRTLVTPPASCTLSLWIKKNVESTTYVANFFVGATAGWGLRSTGGGGIEIYDDIGNADTARYNTIIPRKYVHVVATFDGTDRQNRLYVDGRLVGSGAVSSAALTSLVNASLVLNNRSTTSVSAFPGEIVNPQIFSEVKDQAWVTAEYQKGARALLFMTGYGHTADGVNRTTPEILGDGPFYCSDAGVWQCTTAVGPFGNQQKVFKCTTPGHIAVDLDALGVQGQQQGFGSWGAWVYVPSTASLRWQIVNSSDTPAALGTGYYVNLAGATGVATLEEAGVGVLVTGTFLPDQWTYVHVTRRYDGLFELFVNLTSQGTATDLTTVVGQYMCFQGEADCLVSVADVNDSYAIRRHLGVTAPSLT